MFNSLRNIIRNYPLRFWLLNIIQMTERLAYWIVVLQMPIYIAQKDIPGGLQWEQTTKGIIYFWWAFMQNAVPLIAGGYADRYGRRRFLVISFVMIIIGYSIMGTTDNFILFLLGVVILGTGSGIFKPTIQGAIANTLNEKTSSIGWGMYVMLINIAVFFGPPLSIYLKNISWNMVFYGSAILFSLNFITVMFIGKFTLKNYDSDYSGIKVLKQTFKGLLKKRVLYFVLIMSGFTLTYMQFYETLPNFIYDWSDTSSVAAYLNEHFTMNTNRGTMVSYEWLYNLNAGFVIVGVVFFSWLMRKFKTTNSIAIGITLAGLGLMTAGLSMSGYVLIFGMLLYTLGEMITNPRFTEYMSSIAPKGEKSLFMGYMSISWAFGLAGGGILGGFLYKHLGEKAGFALKYLNEKYSITDISINNAFDTLLKTENLTATEATNMLWNLYNPYLVWMPFVTIISLSVLALYLYKLKIK
jgi:POT family proton-dependent oligopeptide transporter